MLPLASDDEPCSLELLLDSESATSPYLCFLLVLRRVLLALLFRTLLDTRRWLVVDLDQRQRPRPTPAGQACLFHEQWRLPPLSRSSNESYVQKTQKSCSQLPCHCFHLCQTSCLQIVLEQREKKNERKKQNFLSEWLKEKTSFGLSITLL